jgi:hypothetical protein
MITRCAKFFVDEWLIFIGDRSECLTVVVSNAVIAGMVFAPRHTGGIKV